mmetsp:Transcript_10666/g.32287  ORF Transcript_10666/g.32287 Transcript_10666/m.32287 type:complete len:285 (+) Transcript_10666:928-1782(+)
MASSALGRGTGSRRSPGYLTGVKIPRTRHTSSNTYKHLGRHPFCLGHEVRLGKRVLVNGVVAFSARALDGRLSGVGLNLRGAVEAITHVAEARQHETLLVDGVIHLPAEHLDVRVLLLKLLQTGAAGNSAEHDDLLGAPVLEDAGDGHDGAGGRNDGLKHEADVRRLAAARKAVVVLNGEQRVVAAVHADVVNRRHGQQLEHGIGHAEAGAEHRHERDGVADLLPNVGRNRRLHGLLHCADVARRLVAHVIGDLLQEHAEVARRRRCGTQLAHLVKQHLRAGLG